MPSNPVDFFPLRRIVVRLRDVPMVGARISIPSCRDMPGTNDGIVGTVGGLFLVAAPRSSLLSL